MTVPQVAHPLEVKDPSRAVLSALWTFVTVNYLYVDLTMMMFRPGTYATLAARMSESMVLGASMLMEILIAMILLSRVLPDRLNRLANIIAGLLGTAFALFPLLGGRPPAFYLFLSLIEIATTSFIVWYAWTWPRRGDLPARLLSHRRRSETAR